eukprot:Sspe_Gene.70471::Locus_41603_Transcript_1_1_Confidence_1.000_Length_3412::g.70471::m.70471
MHRRVTVKDTRCFPPSLLLPLSPTPLSLLTQREMTNQMNLGHHQIRSDMRQQQPRGELPFLLNFPTPPLTWCLPLHLNFNHLPPPLLPSLIPHSPSLCPHSHQSPYASPPPPPPP